MLQFITQNTVYVINYVYECIRLYVHYIFTEKKGAQRAATPDLVGPARSDRDARPVGVPRFAEEIGCDTRARGAR